MSTLLQFKLPVVVALFAVSFLMAFQNASAQKSGGRWTPIMKHDPLVGFADAKGKSLVASAGEIIISEFSVRGLLGANDEFIEIYNASGAAHTVAGGETGYAVAASDGVARCVIPNGTVIPNKGHYLCVNSVAYSLASYPAGNGTTATGNATYTTEIPDNAGIAIFNTANPSNFTLTNRLDAAGAATEANTLYKEGAGYAPLSNPFSMSSFSLVRNMASGLPQDTNSNSADFLYVDTNATDRGQGRRLGGPGPENLSSPIQRNATVRASLVFACIASHLPPNRVRDLTAIPVIAPLGTLEFRRTFTNNTGAPVTRLRFRVVDITTTEAPPGTADVRTISSNDLAIAEGDNPCGTGAVQLRGTSMEGPPFQGFGGGLNTSLTTDVVSLATPLAAGASINIRLVVGVTQNGTFRFFVNVEALP